MLKIASVVVLCIIISDARIFDDGSNQSNRKRKEFEEFLEWNKGKQLRRHNTNEFVTRAIGFNDDRTSRDRDTLNPPPVDKAALMARYVVNQADWASVATISTRKDVDTFPIAGLVSISDGSIGNGSGIPYMYLTPLDYTAQDITKDHRASLLVSLAQGNYCKTNGWDSMDPRCARVILTGKIKALKNSSAEYKIAEKAVFDRHPKLKNMPADHYFFFAKLEIMAIVMLDTFGGPKYITVNDYLHPLVNNMEELQQGSFTKPIFSRDAILRLQFPEVRRI